MMISNSGNDNQPKYKATPLDKNNPLNQLWHTDKGDGKIDWISVEQAGE